MKASLVLLVALATCSPAVAQNDAAIAQAAGGVDPAIAQLIQKIQSNPNDIDSYVQLGRFYLDKGDFDSAIADLTQAAKVDPYDFQIYFNRARAYNRKGEVDLALADYGLAIHYNPHAHGAYANRGQIYEQMGKLDEGIADESQSIAIDPKHASPFNFRANCYAKKGDYEKAAADYATALQLSPTYHAALNNYAWLLATCPEDSVRDGKSAVNEALLVCNQTNWTWPAPIDTLAAAYAASGDFDSAIKWENKFLASRISDTSAQEAQQRLALYQSHQPYLRTDGADGAPANEEGPP